MGEKIDNSPNKKIKYAKGTKNINEGIAESSGEAILEVFSGISDGARKVGKQIGVQSRKIVHKKLGEDYVNTFIPEDEE